MWNELINLMLRYQINVKFKYRVIPLLPIDSLHEAVFHLVLSRSILLIVSSFFLEVCYERNDQP